MEKIPLRLEELNPEIWKMVEDLEDIGWELEDYIKIYGKVLTTIQAKKYDLEKFYLL